MAAALLVVSAISTIASAVKQKKIAKAQEKQNKIANKVSAIGRSRKIKQAIASSRIQAAEAQAAGFQLGVSGGTAVQGAVQGVRQDTASAIGSSNLQTAGSGFIADIQSSISSLQGQVSTFQTISSIATSIAGSPQAVGALEDAFGFSETATALEGAQG